MLARLTFIAALAFAPMAAAQETTTPPSAEEIAAARALADRVIAAAEAQGIFVNKTDDNVAQVEHVASGMRCIISDDAADRLHIFPTGAAGIPRGGDVACISHNAELGTDTTLYATHYPERPTTREIVVSAVEGIRQRWPDAAPYQESLALANVQGFAPTEHAAFKIRHDGVDKLTMVVGAQEGDWSLKVRATGPYEDAMTLSLQAAMLMAYAQMSMNDGDE